MLPIVHKKILLEKEKMYNTLKFRKEGKDEE